METKNHIWTVIDTNTPPRGTVALRHKNTGKGGVQILAMVMAGIFSMIMGMIGIAWLSAILIVLISGKLLGFTVFFGIPPIILALLITAGTFIAYWPVALIAKGLWSLAEKKNKYRAQNIITGAIFFSVAIATLVIIAVNLGRNINFEYKDKETQILIEDGNICVSDVNYCEKY